MARTSANYIGPFSIDSLISMGKQCIVYLVVVSGSMLKSSYLSRSTLPGYLADSSSAAWPSQNINYIGQLQKSIKYAIKSVFLCNIASQFCLKRAKLTKELKG
jgi:hypothetical protein